jgi:hypothetical protein
MAIFAVQKFVIKLFGGLVPGTLFLIGASLSLIPGTYLIICFVSGVIPISLMKFGTNFFNAIKNTPNNIWLPVFGIMATLTYVVGHLFYQRDPEKPDQRGFKKQSKKPEFPTKDIKDRVVKLREELACSEEKEVKVPYSNGKEKIGREGLCHICSLILSKESDHRHYRNKNFIDITKLHIKHHFPQKYRTIIRNEAHIQLTSSLWYVSHSLRVFGIMGLVSVLIAVYIMHGFKFDESYVAYISFIIPQIFVLLASEYIRTRIEKFIHDQRLSEVIFILETAFTALRESPQYLRPPLLRANQSNIKTT